MEFNTARTSPAFQINRLNAMSVLVNALTNHKPDYAYAAGILEGTIHAMISLQELPNKSICLEGLKRRIDKDSQLTLLKGLSESISAYKKIKP